MIIVIQCAATKRPDAGRFLSPDGKPVVFVADPHVAPRNNSDTYARPDDVAEGGKSWRDLVRSYNERDDNPRCPESRV